MAVTKRKKTSPAACPAPVVGLGYLGIDPGLKGGLGWIPARSDRVWGVPMPVVKGDDGRACLDLPAIVAIVREARPRYAAIELVTAGRRDRTDAAGNTRTQGVTGMFSFGRGVGELMGILAALGVPVVRVRPQTWKRQVLGPVVDREAERADPKARALAFVAERYPIVRLIPPRCKKPHDGIADAVCLAHLAREIGGKLTVERIEG